MQDSVFWNPLVPELMVSNFERSLEFYTDVLGFSVLYTRSNPRFCYLDQGNAQIMLQELHESYWETGELIYPSGRGVNFQIELNDIETIHSKLKAISYALYEDMSISEYEAGEMIFYQKEFLVQDPDGYLLRFCQQVNESGDQS